MRTIGNIIWIIFGGLETAILWCVAGLVCMITIVGIPLGLQCFKFAALTLAPFGKTVIYGGHAPSLIANIIWIFLCGLWMAIGYAMLGLVYCITIVGVPVGLQCFKMSKLALMPFGAEVV